MLRKVSRDDSTEESSDPMSSALDKIRSGNVILKKVTPQKNVIVEETDPMAAMVARIKSGNVMLRKTARNQSEAPKKPEALNEISLLLANRKGKPPPLYEKSKSVTSETHVSSELQKRLQKRQILNGEDDSNEKLTKSEEDNINTSDVPKTLGRPKVTPRTFPNRLESVAPHLESKVPE